MADPLIFDMGKYEARLPTELRYCRNHMWCRPEADGVSRFGFSTYALRLMQDVYFLDWCVSEGASVAYKQQIGNIETSKAVSDLFSPIAGTITSVNSEALKDPSIINVSAYENGWLFTMTGETLGTMTASEYVEYLNTNWEQTQRILKGQMHE
ncbi:glycine cleavage system protein H [Zavarzinella formosa]|uniref:glycine cleavage system protein H n=1 Tax=Zavarzinella formosa TaxID=360055 RepID=UPI0002EF20A6|nr:glycine cleavage system protein H [Zavarzinella formosa]